KDRRVPAAGRRQRPESQSESTWVKEAVIELVEVHKSFGALKVLDGVTCRIPRGEISVLMGPSGTGKSVTLRHVVGLLPPDSGDVFVDGKDVPALSERELLALRAGIGMMFQDGALFSSMHLYDNVAFPLRQHTRKSEREISEKYKATSVVVSHDVGAVRRFADNIGILYKGKMRLFGTKRETEQSDDEFVHQFFNASSEGPLGMD